MSQANVKRALLDANVLYSNFTRDLLLSLFAARLYEAKWTDQINDEWVRHLLKNRSDLDQAKIHRTVEKMNRIKPNPLVKNFEHLIKSIELPDANDCHVLAAAIASRSQKILTWNLKDFPARFLNEFGIEAENPDRFIAALIRENPESVVTSFRKMRERYQKPRLEIDSFFTMLERNKMKETYCELERYRSQL